MNLENTIVLLQRAPTALDALLRELPDAWTHCNEGDGTWSPLEVVAHLIHGERSDWMPRVRVILRAGQSQPFEPVDRTAHLRAVAGRPLGQLLDEFARLRSGSLAELRGLHLGPAELARCGMHPALGPVTLSQLLATWAAHDLTHLHQIARIMAHQYRDAVGPWHRYLGVLHCAGHSEP